MTRTPVSAATKRHMSVAAEFRSLSDELDDLPPVVAHSRTEPQASLVRSSSTKRGQPCNQTNIVVFVMYSCGDVKGRLSCVVLVEPGLEWFAQSSSGVLKA